MTSAVRTPDLLLQCDGAGCLAMPTKAPRIFVPSSHGQRELPLTLGFPHLTWCDVHFQSDCKLDALLDDKAKARFEELARKLWPQGTRPDFDAALIQPIDVYSKEYGDYMARLGFSLDGLGYSLHNRMVRRSTGRVGWL